MIYRPQFPNYGDEFAQDLHLFPFSPEPIILIALTPDYSIFNSCYFIITIQKIHYFSGKSHNSVIVSTVNTAPGGTGMPALVISPKIAPFPPYYKNRDTLLKYPYVLSMYLIALYSLSYSELFVFPQPRSNATTTVTFLTSSFSL